MSDARPTPGTPPRDAAFLRRVGPDWATSVYLATQGALTIGEIAYKGFTAANPNRICWEALSDEDRKRWQQAATAVLVHWRERSGDGAR